MNSYSIELETLYLVIIFSFHLVKAVFVSSMQNVTEKSQSV